MADHPYGDRAEVRAVVADLGLFPAYEMGLLAPELMPDGELRQLAYSMCDALAYAWVFINMFRATLGLPPETSHIKESRD